ncbi:MAG: hypothetical protein ACFFB2_20490 [Promethearchaeota archaeon]
MNGYEELKISENVLKNRLFAVTTGVSLIMLVILVPLLIQLILQTTPQSEFIVFEGSMFSSDAGISHGGFEWTASYTARWSISKKFFNGILNLTLDKGLGSHFNNGVNSVEIPITDFFFNGSAISFINQDFQVILDFVEYDTIWGGTYNNQYIAIQSLNSSEICGSIDPLMVPGFIEWFYIELRLHPNTQLSFFS